MPIKTVPLASAISRRAPKVLVYGDAGSGKTTLIASLRGRVLDHFEE